MVVLALLNGTLRALVTQPWLGEEVARRLATIILLVMLTGYVWLLHRRFALPSLHAAWAVGFAWTAMTLTFEFGFGRLVEGLSWSTMLAWRLARARRPGDAGRRSPGPQTWAQVAEKIGHLRQGHPGPSRTAPPGPV